MIKINPISLANLKHSNSRKNQPSFKLSFVKPQITAEKGAEIFEACNRGHKWDDFLKWIESVNNYHDQALINAFGGARVQASFEFIKRKTGSLSKRAEHPYVKIVLTAPKEDSILLSPFHVKTLKTRIAHFDEKTTVELKPIKVSGDFFKTIRKHLLDLDKRARKIEDETEYWLKLTAGE